MQPTATPRITFVGLVIVVLVTANLGAFMTLAIHTSVRKSRVTECNSNLRFLWHSQFDYARQYGRPCGIMPLHEGRDFWLKLQFPPKPVVERLEVFFCPLSGEKVGVGETSYRGPYLNVNKMDDLDPIGGDKEGNHGPGRGGNVLIKAGDVCEVEEIDAFWIRARETTSVAGRAR